MKAEGEFQLVFERLKPLLQQYAEKMQVKADQPGNYYLDAGYSVKYKKDIFFGAVQIKKNYVSFHLMPLYGCPALAAGISPALKKRMQGKACFNFKTVDEGLIVELAELVQKGFEHYQTEGLC